MQTDPFGFAAQEPLPVQDFVSADDLFGNPLPDGYLPRNNTERSPGEQETPSNLQECVQLKSAPKKKADHNTRTRDYYLGQGFFCFRVDQTRVNWEGAIFTVDFLGLFDWIAMKPGDVRGVQVTAYEALGAHVTKMCSSETTSFNLVPDAKGKMVEAKKCENLRQWLLCGFTAELIGWKQPGGRGSKWEPHFRRIDLARLAEADARRRKTA